MKYSVIFTTVIALSLYSFTANAGTVTGLTSYASDTILNASDLNNDNTQIKSAVDGNDVNISTNTSDIGALDARVTQNESDIGALSGVKSYLSIPARGGFQPYNNEASFAKCDPDTFGWSGVGSSLFVATVNLPHNATITEFTYYFWRSSSTTLETTATLYRQGIPNVTKRELIGVYTSTILDRDHTSGDAKVDVTRNTVDNQNYTYYIEANLPETLYLCTDGARITYTTP